MSAALTRPTALHGDRWYALQHFAIGALGLPRDYLSPNLIGLISRWGAGGRHPRDDFRFAVLTVRDAPMSASLPDLLHLLVADWTRYSVETGLPFAHWQRLLERQSDRAVVTRHTDGGDTDWNAVAEAQPDLPSAVVWLGVWRTAERCLNRRLSVVRQLERLLSADFDRFDFSYAARQHRETVERFTALSALVKEQIGLGGRTLNELAESSPTSAWKTFYSIIASLYCSPHAPGVLVADAVITAMVEHGLTRDARYADHWWGIAERRMSTEMVGHFTVDGSPIHDLLATMYPDLPAVQAWRVCAAAAA